MKNYQKLYYQHYYAQKPNGEHVAVSRRECFAPPEEPTAENPFRQRWFYDCEAGYAIRLSRTKEGDVIGKRNAADRKADERYAERRSQCIWKDTNNCDQDCVRCNRKVSRTVEMDKTYTEGDDGLISKFELTDESADIAAIVEDKALLAVLASVVDRLTPEEMKLWEFLKVNVKKQVIADFFKLTLDGVRYRELRLFTKLRSDKALRGFFEKK